MKINKDQLQKALEIVKPGLSNKQSLIEQASSFAFLNGKVVTYNDEISISHPVEGVEMTGVIFAEELYGFLQKVKQEFIQSLLQDNTLVFKAGKAKAGFTLQEKIELPLEEVEEKGEWIPLPDKFIEGLLFVLPTTSRNQNQPILTCAHVRKDGLIEASDGFRICRYDLKKKMPLDDFLIPAQNAVELTKLTPTHIAEGDGWIHFKTAEGTIFSSKILADKFPTNIDKLLNVEGPRVVFPSALLHSLERAGVFAKRDSYLNESVDVHIEKNKLTVSSKSETGWLEEKLDIEYDEKVMAFSITPQLLKNILQQTLECAVGTKLLKFQSDNWEYVSALRSHKK